LLKTGTISKLIFQGKVNIEKSTCSDGYHGENDFSNKETGGAVSNSSEIWETDPTLSVLSKVESVNLSVVICIGTTQVPFHWRRVLSWSGIRLPVRRPTMIFSTVLRLFSYFDTQRDTEEAAIKRIFDKEEEMRRSCCLYSDVYVVIKQGVIGGMPANTFLVVGPKFVGGRLFIGSATSSHKWAMEALQLSKGHFKIRRFHEVN
jgi:hypothetical protein